ncbi:MAG: 4'-phosphopantetheinyl transferase superfamily protein [Ectothiorhodospiraceae bacterium]|nr:4'-phosphopantetheinyl transferase superfamily protein [Chromatiales bacterium]MCP5155687.1 4'-phosphopantetheinyl transferase superfamily protein [Ectothiorhodospiraceae bacterium]
MTRRSRATDGWDVHRPHGPDPETVDVWRLDLSGDDAPPPALLALLPQAERDAALAMAHPARRCEHVGGRGLARAILGAALGAPPSSVPLVAGAHGKPEVALSAGATDLAFSIAHAAATVLVAVTRVAPVGVDVESPRPGLDWRRIARRYFTAAEQALLDALPEHVAADAFLATWTRKEAVLKAHGGGIAAGLDTFEVAIGSRAEPAVTAIHRATLDGPWTLHDLPLGRPRRGAVAVRAPSARLRLRRASL